MKRARSGRDATHGTRASGGPPRKRAATDDIIITKEVPASPLRSPSKRVKVKREPFTYDYDTASPVKKPRATPKDPLAFKRGIYLAIRNEGGGFFLCQTAQNVFSNNKPFKIRWLTIEKKTNTYRMDYYDFTELECVITKTKLEKVAHERYKLPPTEEERVNMLLCRALGLTDLKPDPDGEPSDEPKRKKRKTETVKAAKKKPRETSKSKSPARAKATASRKSRVNPSKPRVKVQSAKLKTKPGSSKTFRGRVGGKVVKGKAKVCSKAPMKKADKKKTGKATGSKTAKGKEIMKKPKEKIKVDRTDPNRQLVPNPAVKVWEKDPFFETREEVPYISSSIYSKLVFRAVNLNDMKLLQKTMSDAEHCANVNPVRSLAIKHQALDWVIKNENVKAIKIFEKEMNSTNTDIRRVQETESIMETQGTGSYNVMSLGIASIRALTISRGCKEGNNAFTKREMYNHDHKREKQVVKSNVSIETIKLLKANKMIDEYTLHSTCIVTAVRMGYRKLAAKLIEDAEEHSGGCGFTELHKGALDFDGKQELKKSLMREASVKKKSYENCSITPIHCACINPHVKYLTKLAAIAPDYNMMTDTELRRPVHYAAVCEGTGPLQFLLNKNVSTEEVDKRGNTPLILAAATGRSHNVELLLKKASEELKKSDDEVDISKYGIGGVNRANKKGICAIHKAVKHGHMKCVELLVKYGANMEKPLNASQEKVTPLMIAARMGNMGMVKYLIGQKCKIMRPDRLHRTAVIHAIMNGHAHITSYLLHLGVPPDTCDSSGNTCLHYACAYGWYFCMRVLLDAGANPNQPNAWKFTPFEVAYMKGHWGLASILLDLPEIDINVRDYKGNTVLMNEISRPFNLDQYDTVMKLIQEKGASCTLMDNDNYNLLHLLAKQSFPNSWRKDKPEEDKNSALWISRSLKLTELMLEKGCDPFQQNVNGDLPVMLAVKNITWCSTSGLAVEKSIEGNRNVQLITLLFSKMDAIPLCETNYGRNILHCIAAQPALIFTSSGSEILEILISMQKEINEKRGDPANNMPELQKLASKQDNAGETPLMMACRLYSSYYPVSHIPGEDAELQKTVTAAWEHGRNFIKSLIEDFKSELQYTWERKENEEMKSTPKNALHYALQTTYEQVVKKKDTYLHRPCFTMLLDYKPNIDYLDEQGQTPLLAIVEGCNAEMLTRLLLDAGADVNFQCVTGKTNELKPTPLIKAVRCNKLELVKLLLERGADITAIEHTEGYSVLHRAVCNYYERKIDSIKMLTLLLDSGADINVLDFKKRNVLHLAVNASSDAADEPRDLEILLIRKGVNVFAKDIHGRLPLHYTFVKSKSLSVTRSYACGHQDSSRTDPIEMCSILVEAMEGKSVSVADNFGQTALHRAAFRGAAVCCMLLVQRGTDVNVEDNNGSTPLGMAVINKHDSCALTLIQKNANVNKDIVIANSAKEHSTPEKADDASENPEDDWWKPKPVWKWLPRHWTKDSTPEKTICPIFQRVVQNGWQGVTYIILDLMEEFGMKYARAIELAFEINKVQFARTLINRQISDAKLQALNDKGQNLLHILFIHVKPEAAGEQLVREVIRTLIERGVPVNAADNDGMTPLHYASLYQHSYHINIGTELLKADIKDVALKLDVNAKDKWGRTPLAATYWRACKEKDHWRWINELFDHGADGDILVDFPPLDTFRGEVDPSVDMTNYNTSHIGKRVSPLIIDIVHQNEVSVARLLKKVSVNFADSEGMTPVMYAVKMNNFDIVLTLLCKDGLVVPLECTDKIKEYKFAENKVSNNDIEFCVPKFNCTSNIDLSSQDNSGNTVIHHLVCSLEGASYDNTKLLKLLYDAGAPLNIKNKDGKTPLDYALTQAPNLAKGIQKLNKVANAKWVLPISDGEIGLKDGLDLDPVDADADSEAIAKHLEEEELVELAKKNIPLAVPDDRVKRDSTFCGWNKNSDTILEVMLDEDQDIPYDLLMTKVDVQFGAYGMYNFYKMQIVENKASGLYILFNCWGRMGDEGKHQMTPYDKVEEVVKEFQKIFKAKTGNEWSNYKTFVNHPKKYRLVQADQRRKVERPRVKFDLTTPLPSKLPQYLKDMMKIIANVPMLIKGLKYENFDDHVLPFGRINKKALEDAKDILLKLRPLCEEKETLQLDLSVSKLDQYHAICEQIASLSSEYYHLIPKAGYAFETLTPLDDKSSVAREFGQLLKLLDFAYAEKVILAAQHRVKEINPMDYIYSALKCKMVLMNESDPETKYLLRYIHSSSSYRDAFNVEAIFRLERDGEIQRLQKCGVGNRHLLFHGTRNCNLISILSKGLLKEPPNARVTGKAFGRGIYFSDDLEKSNNYCDNHSYWGHKPNSNSKFALICEVALGRMREIREYKDLEGLDEDFQCGDDHDSIVAMSHKSRDAECNVTMPSGAILPLGPWIDTPNPSGIYIRYVVNKTEYIVYNEEQVAMKYIVQFRD